MGDLDNMLFQLRAAAVARCPGCLKDLLQESRQVSPGPSFSDPHARRSRPSEHFSPEVTSRVRCHPGSLSRDPSTPPAKRMLPLVCVCWEEYSSTVNPGQKFFHLAPTPLPSHPAVWMVRLAIQAPCLCLVWPGIGVAEWRMSDRFQEWPGPPVTEDVRGNFPLCPGISKRAPQMEGEGRRLVRLPPSRTEPSMEVRGGATGVPVWLWLFTSLVNTWGWQLHQLHHGACISFGCYRHHRQAFMT